MPDLSLPDPEPATLTKIALQVSPEQWKLSQAEMVEVIINEPGNRMETLFSCLFYTSPSPRDRTRSRMPSSA